MPFYGKMWMTQGDLPTECQPRGSVEGVHRAMRGSYRWAMNGRPSETVHRQATYGPRRMCVR